METIETEVYSFDELDDREAKEEPALIVWAAGILLAALAVIANFI